MRRSLWLILPGLVLTPGAALADPAYAPFEMRSGYGQDWSGAYLGLHAGYGWGGNSNDFLHVVTLTWDPDGDIAYQSATGGMQAGYQQQHDNLVFGVEADLALARFLGDDSRAAGRVNEIEINALGTLRGRLGWAQDSLLIYGTAGLAAASFHKREPGDPPLAAQLATGWTAGGGVELALDEHWRVRAEYLHIRLGDVETSIPAGYLHRANAPAINVLRAGVNYSF
jgi:outer membrane immunogenic protein